MKALWLGRLARPDIIKPINDLASKVQSWSRGDGKRLLRVIQYIHTTPQYRLFGTIQDEPEHLELQLTLTQAAPATDWRENLRQGGSRF